MEAADLVARLTLAAGLGALVGFERERRHRTAGIRTHSLVALGAAIFTVAGAYGFADLAKGPNVDPARVAAQVASGIGFIGAGAIIRTGASVRGLTTAATLWASAALGLASASGQIVAATIGGAIVLAILVGLRAVRRVPLLGLTPSVLTVEYERGHGTIGPLMRAVEEFGVPVERLQVEDDEEASEPGLRRVTLNLRSTDPQTMDSIVEQVTARKEVCRVTIGVSASHPPNDGDHVT